MENLNLIEYKWNQGIYTLDYMIKLVEKEEINKKDFFYITRFNYDGLIKSCIEKKKGV